MSQEKVYLGVDLGGTTMSIGLLQSNGNIIFQSHTASKVHDGSQSALNQIIRTTEDIKRQLNSGMEITAMGIGIAGKVDTNNGVLIEATNLPNWHNVPLGEHLSKALQIPVKVDNDANVAALGEFFYGAGEKQNSMLMVTLGTGVGGGLILDGKLYSGIDGIAGEMGHMIIDIDGPVCNCGKQGCVEAFCGAKGILNRYLDKAQSKSGSLLKDINPDELTPKDISQAAIDGDPLAIETFDEVGMYLGVALANIANMLNIEIVVVGGGVANAGELILKPARKSLIEHALNVPGNRMKIVQATLGDRAGMIGASRLSFV